MRGTEVGQENESFLQNEKIFKGSSDAVDIMFQ